MFVQSMRAGCATQGPLDALETTVTAPLLDSTH